MPPPDISGTTRIIAHLGVPTESFKAPMIYNPWFRHVGENVVVVPMGCEEPDYPAFLKHLFRLRNIAGALVTMPYKVSSVGLLDEASATVEICGACNAIRRGRNGALVGDMFDGEGFVRGVLRNGHAVKGTCALVVGAGGVGSAIAASLAAAGAARLAVFDQRSATAQALATRIAAHYPGIEITSRSNDPTGFDIVVNATPLGMNPNDPLPVDVDRIDPTAFVGEVVMASETTPFLAAARVKGCATQVGTDMLFEQIPAYLEFFGLRSTTPDQLRHLAELDI
ncbi:MAG TPA: shikimate dehydrogenase [Rhodobacteraceae bacterium]|nr:shikimate dehydrogenase [Paracoccaceae bacterium]